MNRLHYICKYTPTELLTALGADCENFNAMPQGFSGGDPGPSQPLRLWKGPAGGGFGRGDPGAGPGELL